MAKLIDADVVLRYLTKDDPKKAQALLDYLTKNKEEKLILNDLTIAEIVWTLSSYYKIKKEKVIKSLEDLFLTDRFNISKKIIPALELYKSHSISFIDSYNASQILNENLEGIISFDKDFDKIKHVKRVEPK